MNADVFNWPPAPHIEVTVWDDGVQRTIKYRCRKCGAEIEESFFHPFRVQTAREAYDQLKEMHKATVNGVDWEGEQARTAKEVRESEGHRWRLKHGMCVAGTA